MCVCPQVMVSEKGHGALASSDARDRISNETVP